MQRREGADLADVRAVAVAALGLSGDVTVERTEGGVAGQVYRVARDTDEWFVRLGDDPEDNLAVDADLHERLLRLGVRVPEVAYVEPFSEILERSVFITAHIGGVDLLSTPDHDRAVEVARGAGRDLGAINRLAVDGFGWVRRDWPRAESLPWPPVGELPDYVSFVVDDLPDPWPGAFGELFSVDELRRFEAIIAAEQERSTPQAVLAHGDFSLDHVFHRDGRYTGIIDFGEIRGTEPLFDLGVFGQSGAHLHRALHDAVIGGFFEVVARPPDAQALIRTAGLMKSLRHLGYWLQPTFTLERPVDWLARHIADRLLPSAERARA